LNLNIFGRTNPQLEYNFNVTPELKKITEAELTA